MSTADRDAWAALIGDARDAGRLLPEPLTDRVALSLDDAYAVQDRLFRRRLDRGERPAGWKIGYTSTVVREALGIAEPNCGAFTDAMLVADGAMLAGPSGGGLPVVQPRVEPEIALVLGADLWARDGEPSPDEAAAAVAEARCALEVVDSVWAGYRFRLEDNTADSSSAAYVVLGPPLPSDADLAAVTATLAVADSVVGEGRGADVLGHPWAALAWLAGQLGRRGLGLRTGDVVITGGLTAPVPLPPGATARAEFTPGGAVAVHRAT